MVFELAGGRFTGTDRMRQRGAWRRSELGKGRLRGGGRQRSVPDAFPLVAACEAPAVFRDGRELVRGEPAVDPVVDEAVQPVKDRVHVRRVSRAEVVVLRVVPAGLR